MKLLGKAAGPRASGAMLVSLWLALGASAASFNYNDGYNGGDPYEGSTVRFENVVETTADPPPPHPPPPLFGGDGVFLFGDQLVFDPSGAYVASTSTPDTTDSTASTLDLDVIVIDDSTDYIEKIILTEFGDFNISGDGEATVSALLSFRVTQVDGAVPTSAIPVASDTMVFTPLGANGNGSYDASDSGGVLTAFDGMLMFDVNAFLLAEGVSFTRGATAIEIFTVNNQLNATVPSGGNGSALIQKKDFAIEIVTAPEPAAFAMLALGLAGLAWRERRHR